MPSRALLLSAAFGCLFLAACSSDPFQATAIYSQGYQAACAAVAAGTAALDPAGATSAAPAAGNRNFRAGWDSGLHCRDSSPFTG